MKQYKWFFLALIGFLFFLGLGIALDCNIAGVRDWRGNKAVFIGLSLALLGAFSIMTLLFQSFKIPQTLGSKFGGILFVSAFILVGVVTILYLSKQYCH